MGEACLIKPMMEQIMFSDAAVTFIRALSGEGATLRSLPEKDAVGSFPNIATKPGILTCDVDADFILKESEETGLVFLSNETKCCIASLMVVVGGDANRDMFH